MRHVQPAYMLHVKQDARVVIRNGKQVMFGWVLGGLVVTVYPHTLARREIAHKTKGKRVNCFGWEGPRFTAWQLAPGKKQTVFGIENGTEYEIEPITMSTRVWGRDPILDHAFGKGWNE